MVTADCEGRVSRINISSLVLYTLVDLLQLAHSKWNSIFTDAENLQSLSLSKCAISSVKSISTLIKKIEQK